MSFDELKDSLLELDPIVEEEALHVPEQEQLLQDSVADEPLGALQLGSVDDWLAEKVTGNKRSKYL